MHGSERGRWKHDLRDLRQIGGACAPAAYSTEPHARFGRGRAETRRLFAMMRRTPTSPPVLQLGYLQRPDGIWVQMYVSSECETSASGTELA